MSEFAGELRQRYQAAQAALREAREGEDEYAADVRSGELDSLRRLADEHDVQLTEERTDRA